MIRRILLVTYEYPPLGGGGGVFASMLAGALSRRLEVTVLTSHRAGLEREERGDGLRIVRVPVWHRRQDAVASLASLLTFVPSAAWRGRALVREGRFDLVHSSFAIPSGLVGAALARAAAVPHVLTAHGGDLYDPSKRLSPHRMPLLRQIVAWVLADVDRVLVPSRDTVERARALSARARLTRIPLAVDGGDETDGEHVAAERDEVRLITVGRLVRRKGLEDLVEIAARLRDRRLRLVIVGEGPLRRALEEDVAARGLANVVEFTGRVDEAEKWRLLRGADVYVSPTRHEAFGIALLEGLAAGLPVVAYDCGGHRDFCAPTCSHLVPLGDRDALVRRIAELIDEPESRRRMGEAGKRVAAEYGVERLAERHLQVYEETVSRPRGARRGEGVP